MNTVPFYPHEGIMTWARLDDNFPDHPKIVAAGPICELIQVRAICYCCRYLTDGFLPLAIIPTLLVRLDGAMDWPEEMVMAGLWDRVAGGYRCHDFLDYNPTKKSVLSHREERRQAGLKGAMARWQKMAKPMANSRWQTDGKRDGKPTRFAISAARQKAGLRGAKSRWNKNEKPIGSTIGSAIGSAMASPIPHFMHPARPITTTTKTSISVVSAEVESPALNPAADAIAAAARILKERFAISAARFLL